MKQFLALFLLTLPLNALADSHPVKQVRCTKGFPIQQPVMVDQQDVDGKAFDAASLLGTTVNADAADEAPMVSVDALPEGDKLQIRVLQFALNATADTKLSVKVSGLKHYKLFLDRQSITSGAKTDLSAGSHKVRIKYFSGLGKDDVEKPAISYDVDDEQAVTEWAEGPRMLSLHDIMDGRRPARVSISPSGRYLITAIYDVERGGKTTWKWQIYDQKLRQTVLETERNISWMPRSEAYYYTETTPQGRRLVSVSMTNGQSQTLAEGFPEGGFSISPDEQSLIISVPTKIKRDGSGVKAILEPDDRQPGWRNRQNLVCYDLTTKQAQPLTFGHRSLWPCSVSEDGRYLLYMVSQARLSKRPTTVSSIYRLDLQTLDTLCLVRNDGFIASAEFSPDGKTVLVKGSPEALDGIGKNVPEGRTPSMYDYQLFLIDVASGRRTALTRDFNPSIEQTEWSAADNQIYFTALDGDYIRLYRLNPRNGKIEQLSTQEDLVSGFSLSRTGRQLAWYGEGASNSYRVYAMDLKSEKSTLVHDYSKDLLKDIELGECRAWTFNNGRGDTISARYYLPPRFNEQKKYPMIVNYYGGCSPTSRNFESRYPQQLYASMGYVVLVINPSGAAGFGQEFSSRHVNTAGDEVAEDIIAGTRQFWREHSYVDSTKVGCIGASYGGFMTQYLQTKTDIFAAAVSHAGISDHTSYWGGGYWGYSYSEVSMANSYPWTRRDLYVDHSPIYNVDKIHTPILFTHGIADTNVPVLESIQMYTALKLLGRETALIEVEGENHWIMDYQKRQRWQAAIFAWFRKWLQGDEGWWKEIYK